MPKESIFDRFSVFLLLIWVLGAILVFVFLNPMVDPPATWLIVGELGLATVGLVVILWRVILQKNILILLGFALLGAALSFFRLVGLGYIWDTVIYSIYARIHPLIVLVFGAVTLLGVYLFITSCVYLNGHLGSGGVLFLVRLYLRLDPSGRIYRRVRAITRSWRVSPRYEMVLLWLIQRQEQWIGAALNRLEIAKINHTPDDELKHRLTGLMRRLQQYQSALDEHYRPVLGHAYDFEPGPSLDLSCAAALEAVRCFIQHGLSLRRFRRLGGDLADPLEPAAKVLTGYVKILFDESLVAEPHAEDDLTQFIVSLSMVKGLEKPEYADTQEALTVFHCMSELEGALGRQDYQSGIFLAETFFNTHSQARKNSNQSLFEQLRQLAGCAWTWYAQQFTQPSFQTWAYQRAFSYYWQAGDAQSLGKIQP